jgi:hypothetical protein
MSTSSFWSLSFRLSHRNPERIPLLPMHATCPVQLAVIIIAVSVATRLQLLASFQHFEKNKRKLMRSLCSLSISLCIPVIFVEGLMRSPYCLCPSSIILSFSMRSVSYQGGFWDNLAVCVTLIPNFFVFYAVRVLSRRLLRSSCCLCPPSLISSFSMRSVSYQGGFWDHLAVSSNSMKVVRGFRWSWSWVGNETPRCIPCFTCTPANIRSNFIIMLPFQRHIKNYFKLYALPLPEGRAGTAWEPSKPEI